MYFSGAVAGGAILDRDDVKLLPEVILGPGQIHPRGYRLTSGHYGEIKLGLLMTKGQLEVEVLCARNIACEARESMPGNKTSVWTLTARVVKFHKLPNIKGSPLAF
jgi:hypothetical protein